MTENRYEIALQGAKTLIFQNKREYAASLPTHLREKSDGWLAAAFAAVRRDPKLVEAAMESPHTLVNALSMAAQKGLTPGTEEFYLTPRKSKGRQEVLGVTGYQGEVELMYRAGAVSSVIVENVYSGDKFEYVPGKHDKPIHTVDWFGGDRGKLIGSYAYAIMKDGAVSRVVIVDQGRIQRAKDASMGSDSNYSPWVKHEAAMWLKTAAHDLSKWVPTSAEFLRETEKIKAEAAQVETAPKAPAPEPQQSQEAPRPAPAEEYWEAEEVIDGDTGEVLNWDAAEVKA